MTLPENVLSVRLFGSQARGDSDILSDCDILVVVADRTGKVDENVIHRLCEKELGKTPTISWYGVNRLKKMFRDGHLFAWHL
ncbi:MAG: nucleotidyltransferase domain-containing protein, partial [Gammaproteobacteria bacterium]|nr:nucleotidyltransferase domain-containing protein [Gammaproteobacteria bacterium]